MSSEDEKTTLLNLETISNISGQSFLTHTNTDTETTIDKDVLIQKRFPKKPKKEKLLEDQIEEELSIEKLKVNWKKFDFEMAIRNVNDSGNYQKAIMMVSVVCLFGCSFTSYLLGFIAPDPITECQ